MRPKFVLVILLAAGLVLGAVFFLGQHGKSPVPPPDMVTARPAAVDSNAVSAAAPAPIATRPAATNVLTPEQRQAAIDAETDRLQEWCMSGDPVCLSNILADLTSPENEIRDAAIEATIQFGSTNAIPALKAAAAKTDDTDEQIALLEAAKFLSLPSLSSSEPDTRSPELIQADQQRNAERTARRQARMNHQASSQQVSPPATDTGSPPPADQNPPPNSNP